MTASYDGTNCGVPTAPVANGLAPVAVLLAGGWSKVSMTYVKWARVDRGRLTVVFQFGERQWPV